MDFLDKADNKPEETIDEITLQYYNIDKEADTVRESDRVLIKGLFRNFYGKRLNVGIGYQRAYGSLLAGDYFELIKLPDGNYLFIFADISGHGLPAYTTLIRFRSAVSLVVKESEKYFARGGVINTEAMVRHISEMFTDIMEAAGSEDFASVIFTFIRNEKDKFYLRFFNRGMYFPVVLRRFEGALMNVHDLNVSENGWIPLKAGLLGSSFRRILEQRYELFPSCEFILYEGDSILYFSDGVVEAHKESKPGTDYGIERVIALLKNNKSMFPQATVNMLFEEIYEHMEDPRNQDDDMTAVLIDFPLVR